MGLIKKFFAQTRKPEGFLGSLMLSCMNLGHARGADWALDFLKDVSPSSIVDLGCGGGRNVKETLSRYPDAKVAAVDYSALSVERTRKKNARAVASGRLSVRQEDVAELPFGVRTFDLATAFETVYFWPDLEKCFSEVRRVLTPGGYFLIFNESDGVDEVGRNFEKIIDGMKCYTAEELTAALTSAGFSDVRIERRENKPWLAVIARK
ncbi:MAG: class I SAM-dependent methyltransferase [Thermoguttaceae bacterium]|nr:class I SAM-dependent methyltransferase [Thermoguttaceae bacterium]